MILYFADGIQYCTWPPEDPLYKRFPHYYLDSYFKKGKGLEKMLETKVDLFLDSGAFSAWSKGVSINIDEYIAFIKKYKDQIKTYAVLDDINSAEQTAKNQKYMESKGLKPLPCFHYNEREEILKWYIDKGYEYMALGGMVPISTPNLMIWLDHIWDKYLTNDDGTARIKVHGFGMTSLDLLKRYPWYSVDSTSWVMTGRFGSVFCNLGSFTKVTISEKGDQQDGAHWSQLTAHDQENIRNYFKGLGYTIEELASDYKKRDEVNIIYFLNLEKELTKNPPRFKKRQMELFEL